MIVEPVAYIGGFIESADPIEINKEISKYDFSFQKDCEGYYTLINNKTNEKIDFEIDDNTYSFYFGKSISSDCSHFIIQLEESSINYIPIILEQVKKIIPDAKLIIGYIEV